MVFSWQYTADPVRLVSRSGKSNGTDTGRLEIFINGEWGTVCGRIFFTKTEADVACRQLGFSMGSVSSTDAQYLEWVVWCYLFSRYTPPSPIEYTEDINFFSLADFPRPLVLFGWVTWTAPLQVTMLTWGLVWMEEGATLLTALMKMIWYSPA